RERRERRRARALQEPADRRLDLRQRQSAHLGAMVWRLAGDRCNGRAHPHLARPDPARQRGGGARGRPSLARQRPLGDRLSGQGDPPRGEPLVSAAACLRAGSHALIAVLTCGVIAVAAPAARAMSIERVVSPGGIEAWLVSDRTLPLIAMEFAFVGG